MVCRSGIFLQNPYAQQPVGLSDVNHILSKNIAGADSSEMVHDEEAASSSLKFAVRFNMHVR